MSSNPEVKGDELLCEGRRVKLYRRTVEYAGEVFVRDVVAFGEAVVVAPVKEDGKLVFVRQWRAPLKQWIVELPAGRVEPGEDPGEAARRELLEETGCTARTWEYIGSFSTAPGYSDEILHFFVARGLEKSEPAPEKGEVLSVIEMRPSEYLELVRGGLGDLKTLAGVLLVARMMGV